MTVILDAKAAAVTLAPGVNTIASSNLTIGTGNCLVATFFNNAVAAVFPVFTSITWGSQNLNLIPDISQEAGSAGSGLGVVAMWVLMNPTPGVQTLTFTWSGGAQLGEIYSASFNNVGGFVVDNVSSAGTTASYLEASGSGHLIVDAIQNTSQNITGSSGVGQTQLVVDNTSVHFGQSYIANQTSPHFFWTFAASASWSAVTVDLFPQPGPSALSFEGSPVMKRQFGVINT
jgi:hypothetical protein